MNFEKVNSLCAQMLSEFESKLKTLSTSSEYKELVLANMISCCLIKTQLLNDLKVDLNEKEASSIIADMEISAKLIANETINNVDKYNKLNVLNIN